MQSDSGGLKRARLSISPGLPMQITDEDEDPSIPRDEDAEYRSRVGKAIKSYLVATRELLNGKYRSLRDVAPTHMTSACLPVAFVFPEGVIVRYDRLENPDLKVASAKPTEITGGDGAALDVSLTTMVPLLSENFLHCVPNPAGYDPGPNTPTISLGVGTPDSGIQNEFLKQRIFIITSPPTAGPEINSTILRPVPTVSIRNEFDLSIHFETESDPTKPPRRFLIRSRFRIPVGWEALELFPRYPIEAWNSNTAALWAENDLLAAVLQRNLHDSQFKALDPMSDARKKMARILSECEKLLSGNEEPLHQYIKANPELLCPTHCRMWSKIPLGKRATDFIFREPSGEYLLVELESPLRELFRGDGQQREDLTHAVDQVIDWRRYIEDNLGTVQHELGLEGISANPSCLVVIGRAASLNEENRRKLVSLQNTMSKIKILTYDDLLANARASAENILGPLWDPGGNAEVYLLS